MDDLRFDAITRSFAAPGSRRRLLGGMLAGALALVGVETVGAVPVEPVNPGGRATGDICRKSGDCASGICTPPDRTGRRRCGCQVNADCGKGFACQEGICIFNPG